MHGRQNVDVGRRVGQNLFQFVPNALARDLGETQTVVGNGVERGGLVRGRGRGETPEETEIAKDPGS